MDFYGSIKNLELMSQELDRVANTSHHYNTEYAKYLEIMSWEMLKHANELRKIECLFNVTHSKNIGVV